MPAGGVERLQGAQEVPAAALLRRRHPEELEKLSPPQTLGSYHHSEDMARVQRKEAIPPNTQDSHSAASDLQRLPGSTQVRETWYKSC